MAPKNEKKTAAPKNEKNLPAKKGNQDLALMDDLVEDQGMGLEGMDKDCFAIPFLTILQSGSPQCKKSDGAYIKGAEEGMMFNTATKEMFDGEEGVLFVPCAFARRFVEWVPKDDGGGYRGDYAPGDEPRSVRDDDGNDVLENGHHLVDTRYHYGFIIGADMEPIMVVIAMAKTQLKKSKNWATVMDGIRVSGPNGKFCPPSFAYAYRLTTVPESNDKGSWFGWNVGEPEPLNDRDLYLFAKNIWTMIKEGKAKAAEPQSDVAVEDGSM